MTTRYKEITCASALHKLNRKIPFGWDLNLYRGCEHDCQYCFAMYSHPNREVEFGDEVYVKTNIVECLRRELSKPSWKRELVSIGGVTDSYQPCEAKYQLMPEILKLMIQYRTPCIISTKSDLILRDYDLIKQLSDITYVNIAATITVMDETKRAKLEPQGVSSLRRFEMLKKFSDTNASVGVHIMPIIPYISDDTENLDEIFHRAKLVNADYVLPGTLYLRGKTRYHFFDFVSREYPEIYPSLYALYQNRDLKNAYKKELYQRIDEIKKHYQISTNYRKGIEEKMAKDYNEQLSLF